MKLPWARRETGKGFKKITEMMKNNRRLIRRIEVTKRTLEREGTNQKRKPDAEYLVKIEFHESGLSLSDARKVHENVLGELQGIYGRDVSPFYEKGAPTLFHYIVNRRRARSIKALLEKARKLGIETETDFSNAPKVF